jgi:hypothetical protein
MRAAFKEWAIIVDALKTGRQILIFRKGGISEGRGGFRVEHPAFWFFPTFFHQQREAVIEEAQERYDQIAPTFPPPTIVRLECFAQVVAAHSLHSLAQAQQLRGQHIWRDEVIAERFEWGKSKAIHVLALRTFHLPKPIELPMEKAYGGCKSWIDLPAGLSDLGAEPALSAEAFAGKLHEFNLSLENAPVAP